MALDIQDGSDFGGTGVWTGPSCRGEFSRATKATWDENSRIRDGKEGYITRCAGWGPHLLLVFSNGLRFVSTVIRLGFPSGAAAGLRHRGHG